jgi:NAD(P)-dependent dehydrogenase (short-subunit alcohol dehydrogenase family)
MKPLIHVEGKVALVTGGSRGIGEAIAAALGEAGAKVAISARKIEGLTAAAERLRARGVEVEAFVAHAGKTEDTKKLVADVVKRFGKIDILVNNAATSVHFGPMLTADDGVFDKTFEVNARGYFNMAKAVAEHLIDRRSRGSIINVASIAGLVGSPLQGVYAMTKAAVISMTKTMAVELGPSGIRVNAIAPGLVETRLASALTTNKDILERIVGRTPLARYSQPDDVAGAALFLASDAAGMITGHTLVVDGGMTIA